MVDSAPNAMEPPDPIAQYGESLDMPSEAEMPNARPCVIKIISLSGNSATPSLVSVIVLSEHRHVS